MITTPLKDSPDITTNQVEYKPLVIGQEGPSHPKINDYNSTKGYSLRMTVDLTCSYLWTSPYSVYQQELFSLICKLHDDDGWDFKRISDWLNGNGYKSPRGMTFKENHVWSIYMKKHRSIKRFSREYDPEVVDMKVDVVDYLPNPEK